MHGKRTVLAGVIAIAVLTTACGSSAVPASNAAAASASSPAVTSSPSVASLAPVPSVAAKGGGGVIAPLKGALATVTDEGANEKDLVDTLRQMSAGAIDISVSPSWRQPDFTAETELIQDVAAGKAQIGIVGLRAFDTVGVTSFEGLMAPFTIDSFDLQAKVLESDWAQKLLDGTRAAGVVGLGYVQGTLRRPLGITRPFNTASSFEGATFGIRPSKVSEMILKALGATPKSWSDLDGLDGIEMDTPSIVGNHYDGSAKALTGNLVLWARPQMFFANTAWFDGLSGDQQAALRSAAAAVDGRTIDRVKADAAGAAGTLCKRSIKVANATPSDIDALRAKVQPVIDQLETDPGVKSTIESIASLRGSIGTDVFSCSATAANPTPPPDATLLDGTWTTSFTKAELIASPLLADQGEINDGNWGDWTLTFGNGRVSYTQRNPAEDSSSSGTFTVKGDLLTMAFDQGANDGETFAYRWSIYKDTLTFRRDDAVGIAPTPFMVKAWTKS